MTPGRSGVGERGVACLRGLGGDAEHEGDRGPGVAGSTGGHHGVGHCVLGLGRRDDRLGDGPQLGGVTTWAGRADVAAGQAVGQGVGVVEEGLTGTGMGITSGTWDGRAWRG